MTGSPPWSEAGGRLLKAVLDEIIPASADGRIPAAGALGIAVHLARAAADSPALAALLRQSLAEVARLAEERGTSFEALDASRRADVVEALKREAPEAFAALLRHTYMGYYSRADIRPHFGLSDRPTQPEGYELADDDPDELADLVASVRGRGRCYRVA